MALQKASLAGSRNYLPGAVLLKNRDASAELRPTASGDVRAANADGPLGDRTLPCPIPATYARNFYFRLTDSLTRPLGFGEAEGAPSDFR